MCVSFVFIHHFPSVFVYHRLCVLLLSCIFFLIINVSFDLMLLSFEYHDQSIIYHSENPEILFYYPFLLPIHFSSHTTKKISMNSLKKNSPSTSSTFDVEALFGRHNNTQIKNTNSAQQQQMSVALMSSTLSSSSKNLSPFTNAEAQKNQILPNSAKKSSSSAVTMINDENLLSTTNNKKNSNNSTFHHQQGKKSTSLKQTREAWTQIRPQSFSSSSFTTKQDFATSPIRFPQAEYDDSRKNLNDINVSNPKCLLEDSSVQTEDFEGMKREKTKKDQEKQRQLQTAHALNACQILGNANQEMEKTLDQFKKVFDIR